MKSQLTIPCPETKEINNKIFIKYKNIGLYMSKAMVKLDKTKTVTIRGVGHSVNQAVSLANLLTKLKIAKIKKIRIGKKTFGTYSLNTLEITMLAT